MKCKGLFPVMLVIGLLVTSCEDIFEPDIAGARLQLLLPAEKGQVANASVALSWEKLDGARSYKVQLASPSFSGPTDMYLDTIVTRNFLVVPLQPGNYAWRVKAMNAGYETAFSERTFSVDTSSNLSGSQVRLLLPLHGSATNKTHVEFAWEPVAQAERYLVEFLGGMSFDTVLYGSRFHKILPPVTATYSWRVTALNVTGLTVSPTRSFSTDYTAPVAPELLFPRTDTTVFHWPVTLKWKWAADDVAYDSLYLYTADRTTLVPSFPKRMSSLYHNLTQNNSMVPGEYYWAVKSIDQAGNTSHLSGRRKFVVR